MHKKPLAWGVVLFCLILSGTAGNGGTQRNFPSVRGGAAPSQFKAPSPKVDVDYGKIPLFFIANKGQFDEQVAYYAQGKDKTLYFTPGGVTIALNQGAKRKNPPDPEDPSGPRSPEMVKADIEAAPPARWVVKLDFVGANPGVRPEGEEKIEAVISYFKGKPDEWKSGLETFSKIVYKDLWPGIDLIYGGTVNRLKYEFLVHPGGDPSLIRLAYRGADTVAVTEESRLAVSTPVGGFEDDVPIAWQEGGGKKSDVAVTYRISASLDGKAIERPEDRTFVYGFDVGEYDRTRPLVLDPAVLVYCGFIGGAGDDSAKDLAVDSAGNAYVVGELQSPATGFPVAAGPDLAFNGDWDAFVAKVNASGTGLSYCGFIGGSATDTGSSIAVDSSGNAYVTGQTDSSEASFPVVTGPDSTSNGGLDAFVAKVNASGTALSYCGYVGGSSVDSGTGIAVDSSGNAYLTGLTWSTEASFPVAVGPDLTSSADWDAFVAKVNASGTGLSYCGFICGEGSDTAQGIAVDASGNAYITGYTSSTAGTFPVAGGPDLSYNGGTYDAFVAKVNAAGSALSYCGYIGGSDEDDGMRIAVDHSGNAYITGFTYSSEITFPVGVGPDLAFNGGTYDAFVAKVNAAGSALSYCGYIGGSDYEIGYGIAVDGSGNAYVTGSTQSSEATFPVVSGPDLTQNGYFDAFVAKVNVSGTALSLCGYIGGSSQEDGRGIALDGSGNIYVAGYTYSTEPSFPVATGPDITFNGGISDAFVAKIDDQKSVTVTSPNGGESWAGGSVHNVTWSSTGPIANVKLEYSTDGGTNWTTVTASVSNTGTYAWTVPNVATTNGLVRVSDASNASVTDTSNAVFTITVVVAPTITVTSPNGGESWAGGSVHNVTWTSTGTIANVKIEYSTGGGTNWTTVTASTANAGTYAWTVPNVATTNGLVRVSDASNATVSDTSNAVFTITVVVAPTITVTSPNGGESWAGGSVHDVTWSSTGTIADVKIEFTIDAGANWTTVVASMANTGTCTATVPNVATTNGLVRVSDASNATVSDTSNAVFTITVVAAPTITVTSPNGGESWPEDTAHNVTWTSTGAIANVKLEFTTDGGTSWTTFAASNTNSGSASWMVPNIPSTNCLVRVSDAANATVSDVSDAVFSIVGAVAPTIQLSKTKLNFGAQAGGACTAPQPVSISNSGGGALVLTVTPSVSWITVTSVSGTGGATIQIGVNPAGLSASPAGGAASMGLAAGAYNGVVTVSATGATNSPQTVTVNLMVRDGTNPAVGVVDTPTDNTTGIEGSVPVTGWAVDDVEVVSVKIYRDPVAGEGAGPNGYVYIGDAVFVEGARPDVEAAYPTYPMNSRAGWGYMMLTNFLPNQGNGTFVIHAIATDREGNTTLLGSKTITCDNAHAVLPFGAIDVPSQGGTASGSAYRNFAWVLATMGKCIPTDGSTIWAYVDGLPIGHPRYGYYRIDIATLFPGFCNATGAIGYIDIDTTRYANGVHTIVWSATDSAGVNNGFGSRYFTIQNSAGAEKSPPTPLYERGGDPAGLPNPPIYKRGGAGDDLTNRQGIRLDTESSDPSLPPLYKRGERGDLRVGGVLDSPSSGEQRRAPIRVKRGYDLNALPELVYPDKNGVLRIEIKELERVEITLPDEIGGTSGGIREGYLKAGDELRPLPIGSSIDLRSGAFVWTPGPGFLGEYDFIFIVRSAGIPASRIQFAIRINPKAAASQKR